MEELKNKTQPKFCIILPAFHYNRVSRAIRSLLRHNLGESYDLMIVHNKIETEIKNRMVRSPEEIKAITDMGGILR